MPRARSPRRDEVAVRQFVEGMAATLADSGFPRMAARVLIVMMCAEEAQLGAGDLAERLDVSPAAVSGAVRYLVHMGLLQRVPVPGSRRDAYRLPADAWYSASVSGQAVYASFADLATTGVSALGGEQTAAGARVAQMRDFFRFIHDELGGVLERWQRSQGVPGMDKAGTVRHPGRTRNAP